MATATKNTGKQGIHVPVVGKTNAGYRIIAQRPRLIHGNVFDPGSDVVLGIDQTGEKPMKFVTWVYTKDASGGYIWGHYIADQMTAYHDFLTR